MIDIVKPIMEKFPEEKTAFAFKELENLLNPGKDTQQFIDRLEHTLMMLKEKSPAAFLAARMRFAEQPPEPPRVMSELPERDLPSELKDAYRQVVRAIALVQTDYSKEAVKMWLTGLKELLRGTVKHYPSPQEADTYIENVEKQLTTTKMFDHERPDGPLGYLYACTRHLQHYFKLVNMKDDIALEKQNVRLPPDLGIPPSSPIENSKAYAQIVLGIARLESGYSDDALKLCIKGLEDIFERLCNDPYMPWDFPVGLQSCNDGLKKLKQRLEDGHLDDAMTMDDGRILDLLVDFAVVFAGLSNITDHIETVKKPSLDKGIDSSSRKNVLPWVARTIFGMHQPSLSDGFKNRVDSFTFKKEVCTYIKFNMVKIVRAMESYLKRNKSASVAQFMVYFKHQASLADETRSAAFENLKDLLRIGTLDDRGKLGERLKHVRETINQPFVQSKSMKELSQSNAVNSGHPPRGNASRTQVISPMRGLWCCRGRSSSFVPYHKEDNSAQRGRIRKTTPRRHWLTI